MCYKIILILFSVLFMQSCSLGQKSKSLEKPTLYAGTKIIMDSTRVPLYKKSKLGPSIIKPSLLKIKGNDFSNQKIPLLVAIINDSISSNNKEESFIKFTKIQSDKSFLKSYQKKEFYQIEFSSNDIEVKAFNEHGVINALASLEYELLFGTYAFTSIEDWPNIAIRAMHINLKAMDPEIVKKVLHRLWRGHFNTALFSIKNSVAFDALDPYLIRRAMKKEDFKSICEYAKKFNISPIPHFALLSHQGTDFVNETVSPELLYNSQTLDPKNPKIYDLIFGLIDETIELINPEIIHIGHDEVTGHTQKQIEKHGQILPSELFLKNVKTINNYLLSKNVKVWMWGDMLINKQDFPKMHPGSFNAPLSYKWLIDSIPKNIVICDWHYKHYKRELKSKLDFSSTDFFLKKGFNVVGATYNVKEVTIQFSNYIIEKENANFNGMIATSWHKLLKGTINNKKNSDNLNAFDSILETSSNAFWNAK